MSARLIWLVGIVITIGMLGLYVSQPRALRASDYIVLDAFQRIAPRVTDPETPVHIVDIDEASLDVLGQWPWPRTYLAELTDRLFASGAAAVGFDILFAEADRTSPVAVVDSWGRFNAGAAEIGRSFATNLFDDHDEVFAQALARGPTVLAISGAAEGAPPQPKSGVAHTGRLPAGALMSYPGALSPLPELAEAASGIGGINLDTGLDGITRSVPMAALYDGVLMPSFAAELLRVAQGAGGHVLRTSEASGEVSAGKSRPVAMQTGALGYPLDAEGHLHIRFGPRSAASITSAHEILEARDLTEISDRIAGTIVLVGSSAQALYDIRATPLSLQVPGVWVHAEILEQIIAGEFLTRPDWMAGAEILLIFVIGLAVTYLATRERPVFGLLSAVVSVAALFYAGAYLFVFEGIVFSPVTPALTSLAVYLPSTTIGLFMKERARRGIRDRFANFLPAQLINEIARNPAKALTPEGAERDLTVMFVDMRRFTTVTEKMVPEDVVRMLNRYLSSVAEALVDEGATIDKFIGDSVMAFWNAPLPVADHPARAMRAILAVERAVEACNLRLEEVGLPRVEVRIGVNTGPAFVGLMGSEQRLSYTCVGDSVTLAARLEGLTRLYGVRNLVGERCAAMVPDEEIAVEIDRVAVKGRSASSPVHTILPNTQAGQSLAALIRRLRAAWLSRDWAAVRGLCDEIEGLETRLIETATLAAHYRDRAAAEEQRPAEAGWTGDFRASEKRG